LDLVNEGSLSTAIEFGSNIIIMRQHPKKQRGAIFHFSSFIYGLYGVWSVLWHWLE
jgi:hypothetical protein